LALFLCICAAAALLTGCNSNPKTPGLTIVASTNVWGSAAQAIAGDQVQVQSIITSPTDDPHSFELTSSQAAVLSSASIVVYNGAGYDHFIDDVLQNAQPQQIISAFDVYKEQYGGKDISPTEVNEHFWYNYSIVQAVADKIAQTLIIQDEAHKNEY
jgi:zinc/manganese transport system substrate-binding protein